MVLFLAPKINRMNDTTVKKTTRQWTHDKHMLSSHHTPRSVVVKSHSQGWGIFWGLLLAFGNLATAGSDHHFLDRDSSEFQHIDSGLLVYSIGYDRRRQLESNQGLLLRVCCIARLLFLNHRSRYSTLWSPACTFFIPSSGYSAESEHRRHWNLALMVCQRDIVKVSPSGATYSNCIRVYHFTLPFLGH